MGELPRPALPAGPVKEFFDQLHALHHRAGWPSLRDMAREVGCSHTTISMAFSGANVGRWGLVELIVETLHGDVAQFHTLWLAATARPGHLPAETPDASPPPAGATRRPSPVERPDPVAIVPRQLPGAVAAFTGREPELAALSAAGGPATGFAGSPATSPAAVSIVAITGTAGVGKTALAVQWGHAAAGEYPDGQIYLDLRGYGPDQPVGPAEALETMLGALGVDRSALPPGVDGRSALYRTLLAGRRMLILLDNARSVDQIRDLVPGTGSCRVVVTSRDSLAALVVRHGATRVALDVLTTAESTSLLRRLLGPRVDAEPAQALALANQCARLPLAIRVAAELAANRPAATLSQLVSDLADEARKLDLLAAGDDDHTAVRTVFAWSCNHLSPAVLTTFELLGVHPGRSIRLPAVAALLDLDVPHARRQMDALARAHLITEPAADLYEMHDLLRAYAAERAAGRSDGDQARLRLYSHYVDCARADPSAGWLDDERGNLVAVAVAAAEHSPAHAIDLSAALAHLLDLRAYYRDGRSVHEAAVRAARRLGDAAGEAAALSRLGTAWMRVGDYRRAVDTFQQALAVSEATADAAGVGAARHGLGVVAWRLGHYSAATEHLTTALVVQREVGDRGGEAAVLYGLGTIHRQLGDYPAALDHQRRALAIFRECGDRVGESRVLNNLGTTLERMGRADEAFDHYDRALALNRVTGNRIGEAVALTNLGSAASRLGRHAEAIGYHEQALPLYVETGYRAGEADGRRGLGFTLRQAGRLDEAANELRAAVALAAEVGEADVETGALVDLGDTLRELGLAEAVDAYRSAHDLAASSGDRYERARALSGLAHLDAAGGAPDAARDRWRTAHALFTDLRVPEADEVRRYLVAGHSADG